MKNYRKKITERLFFLSSLFLMATLIFSCNDKTDHVPISQRISESEIKTFQNSWSLSLVGIATAFKNNGDYKAAAQRHIEKYYGFDDGKVLYKPYLTSDKPFRTTSEGALSYLIGDNASYPEDTGFALTEWQNIRWDNAGIINDSNIAIAMGVAYFEQSNGSETRKNYTICLKKNNQGDLKIIAQKSSSDCE